MTLRSVTPSSHTSSIGPTRHPSSSSPMTDRWVIFDDLKADPGGRMAVIQDESDRRECVTKNMGIPVYTRKELSIIQKNNPSAPVFRAMQKIKHVFLLSRVVSSE